jgi:hypothetical protein
VAAAHPLFGVATAIGRTACTPIDWRAPREIPALVNPAILPPGVGTMVLNTIAMIARHVGIPSLRYAGPYPTAALWRSLATCFRTTADEATFTADALARAARVARDPIAIDFVPAPFERVLGNFGVVEVRGEPERLRFGSTVYSRDGSTARLVRNGDRWAAEVWFGDALWGRMLELADDLTLVGGPWPLPASTSEVVGKSFPPELRVALSDLIVDLIAAPLATAARAVLAETPIRWVGTLGAFAAFADDDGFAVHGALWNVVARHGMARLALALAEALAPLVAQKAQARLAAMMQ